MAGAVRTDPSTFGQNETLRPKPLPILNRGEKCFHHLGLNEFAPELVHLIEPEIVAVQNYRNNNLAKHFF